MSHSQFHCTGRVYLDMHGLIFETSICYWQDQPGSRGEEKRRGKGKNRTAGRRRGKDQEKRREMGVEGHAGQDPHQPQTRLCARAGGALLALFPECLPPGTTTTTTREQAPPARFSLADSHSLNERGTTDATTRLPSRAGSPTTRERLQRVPPGGEGERAAKRQREGREDHAGWRFPRTNTAKPRGKGKLTNARGGAGEAAETGAGETPQDKQHGTTPTLSRGPRSAREVRRLRGRSEPGPPSAPSPRAAGRRTSPQHTRGGGRGRERRTLTRGSRTLKITAPPRNERDPTRVRRAGIEKLRPGPKDVSSDPFSSSGAIGGRTTVKGGGAGKGRARSNPPSHTSALNAWRRHLSPTEPENPRKRDRGSAQARPTQTRRGGNPPRTRNNGTHATHCRRDQTGLPSLSLSPQHRDAQGGTQAPFPSPLKSGAGHPRADRPSITGNSKLPWTSPATGRHRGKAIGKRGGKAVGSRPGKPSTHSHLTLSPNPVLGHRQSRNGPRSRTRSTRLGQEPPLHPPQAGRREQRTGG